MPVGNMIQVGTSRHAWGKKAPTGPPPPPPTVRDPVLHPFASTAPFNLGVATTRVFEADNSARNAWWITKGTAAPGGGIAQINDQGTQYSVVVKESTASDPAVLLRNPDGTVYRALNTNYRIPTALVPPTGLDHNTVIIQPDGTAHDLYKLIKISNTEWTTTSFESIDILGTGIVRGIRAANISLLNGLIRQWEIREVLDGLRDDFGHAVAISIPEDALGPPSPGFIWPANARDSNLITYTGDIPMGSFGAIPAATNADTSVTGLVPKALANTLERYGFYIIDRSATYAIYVEPNWDNSALPAWMSTAASDMKNAWRDQLMVKCRFVSNNTSTTPGGGTIGSTRLAPAPPPLASEL